MPRTPRHATMPALIPALAAAALAALAHAAPTVQDDTFDRDGNAARRAELAQLETTSLDPALLTALQGVTTEQPLTADALEGKVILLAFWSAAEASSTRQLPRLAMMALEHKDDLLVLAVHGKDDWALAKPRLDRGQIRCPVAHDASGALAAALRTDDADDIVLIDRAGMVRVADIEPRDLQPAVDALLAETPDAARADAPRRKALAASLASEAASRAERAAALAASRPSDAMYKAAEWPTHNTGRLTAKNVQGSPLPEGLDAGAWLVEPAAPLNERVVVLDFWATWCAPCRALTPTMQQAQRDYPDDVTVLGITDDDEAKVRAYITAHPGYAHRLDPRSTLMRNLAVQGIPHVVVLSTDGVVRWQGNPLTDKAAFAATLKQIVAADPLIRAKNTQ